MNEVSRALVAYGREVSDLAASSGSTEATFYPAIQRVLAASTEHDDQIGRCLAQTGVVLLSNVRSFGLLAKDPAFDDDGSVPPAHRRPMCPSGCGATSWAATR